jgi:hypothetical protein
MSVPVFGWRHGGDFTAFAIGDIHKGVTEAGFVVLRKQSSGLELLSQQVSVGAAFGHRRRRPPIHERQIL